MDLEPGWKVGEVGFRPGRKALEVGVGEGRRRGFCGMGRDVWRQSIWEQDGGLGEEPDTEQD
ncbi:hypothetical protein HYU14_02615 [Candidatus Woesearchaeota archaeon]|nr:hypothetical protein [Candidatus Woesearchaeota archaeon]